MRLVTCIKNLRFFWTRGILLVWGSRICGLNGIGCGDIDCRSEEVERGSWIRCTLLLLKVISFCCIGKDEKTDGDEIKHRNRILFFGEVKK